MVYTSESDPLCYPGTTVLINKLELQDQAQLEEFELAMFLTRADEPLPEGILDASHYLKLHHHLFQDVYDWAGELRTIRIGKAGNWFCYPEHLENELEKVFSKLASANYLKDIAPIGFITGAAHILSEINAIHPFREGNGRTQMVLLSVIIENAGYTFNEYVLQPKKVLDAMITSFAGNEEPLQNLILEIIS